MMVYWATENSLSMFSRLAARRRDGEAAVGGQGGQPAVQFDSGECPLVVKVELSENPC